MKKFLKYLKAVQVKVISFYGKAKAFITKLIPQNMKDELTIKGGVTVFTECVTLITLLVVSYVALCFVSALV